MSFDSEYLSLGRVGNYGFEETRILLSDIDRVEVEAMPKAASQSLGVVGTLMFVLGGVLVLLAIGCAVEGCNFSFN